MAGRAESVRHRNSQLIRHRSFYGVELDQGAESSQIESIGSNKMAVRRNGDMERSSQKRTAMANCDSKTLGTDLMKHILFGFFNS
jgi:hypothetical protein